jgi:hypothetical protein
MKHNAVTKRGHDGLFVATCACGWASVPTQTRARADQWGEQHTAASEDAIEDPTCL